MQTDWPPQVNIVASLIILLCNSNCCKLKGCTQYLPEIELLKLGFKVKPSMLWSYYQKFNNSYLITHTTLNFCGGKVLKF